VSPKKATIFSMSTPSSAPSSPFDPKRASDQRQVTSERAQKRVKNRRTFVPRKAAVKLTENARALFKALLEKPPRDNIIGIMLNYQQSNSGEPRMVYSFDFVTADDINREYDEGVSLEVIEEFDKASGNVVQVPKPPDQSMNDGLPKLYIHQNAFLKVLGATVDVDKETVTPILYDREGNLMDPNA
jgi:Fe-S cluster assembly iron-binding protein IscA